MPVSDIRVLFKAEGQSDAATMAGLFLLPSAAWAGLLLLAAGLPAGSLVRRRGHRRRARAAGAAIAEAP